MSYADDVEEKDDLDELKCPHCGKSGYNHVMRDYTGYHARETLVHCDNEDCDGLFIIHYKFSHITKLKEEIN